MKTYGEVEVEFHVFLNSALDGDEWSPSCPSHFPAWNQTQVVHPHGLVTILTELSHQAMTILSGRCSEPGFHTCERAQSQVYFFLLCFSTFMKQTDSSSTSCRPTPSSMSINSIKTKNYKINLLNLNVNMKYVITISRFL
jgi:hypothetical protein